MALRPMLLLSICTLLLAPCLVGCSTISMAAGSNAVSQSLHGSASGDPAPVTPLPTTAGSPNTWQTSVDVQSGEDLNGPCNYFLYLADPSDTLHGVLVVYDRSDSRELFTDAQVRSLAAALKLGLLLPEQCKASSFDDIQQNAFAGPGRTLFTALNQFADASSHPELAHSNVLLFGFSAAGVLAATTANYKPQRVLGVVAYDAGAAPQQIDSVDPVQAALGIPFLIISNDEDPTAGTTRPRTFFNRGWKKGAPWAWGVQHGVAHCCALSTKPLILPWISAVVTERAGSSNELNPVPQALGVFANYTCTLNGLRAATGDQNCTISAASLLPEGASITAAQAWLPDASSGAAWLKWVGK